MRRSPCIRSSSLERDTCTPLSSITNRKMRPKYKMVLPAAAGEKCRPSMPSMEIWNMDKVSWDSPREASTPSPSPSTRDTRATSPVSSTSTRDTCPCPRPSKR